MNQATLKEWGGLCTRCHAQLAGERQPENAFEQDLKALGDRLIECETALRALDPTSQCHYWYRYSTGSSRPPVNMTVSQ